MEPKRPCVLALNGGSSSIKFALYETDQTLTRYLSGKVDRIGLPGTTLSFHDVRRNEQDQCVIPGSDSRSAVSFLMDWLDGRDGFASLQATGHRVVHGMKHTEPEPITPALLAELHHIEPYDPDHLPSEIALIREFGQRYPNVPQVACFDTAFHQSMPRVAKLLPLPRRFDAKGVQKYGFHGLSYAYLMEELARVAGAEAAQGRVILAHLGSGASLAGVHKGKSIDTSMGFTPTAGIPMSTRSGDLDPGLGLYFERTENMTTGQFNKMVSRESGLLGISETSSDMRDLLAREADDVRAAEAAALFCYQAKKWVGAFAAALGGVDTLIFSAGIGENCPPIRARICTGLDFLGIDLDESRNALNAAVVSTDSSRVSVRVIRTDEELMIARSVCRILGHSGSPTEKPG
jgi:acetate kinase